MSAAGYVRIHRKLLGNPAFRNDAEAMAFAWMILRAAWRPAQVRYKERTISLARGQLAVSVRDMAGALDRDKAWIERLWKRMKSMTMIETASETGVTVVTICNYAIYQADLDDRETAPQTLGETRARQGRDTEQGKEKREKIKTAGATRVAPRRAASATDLSATDLIDLAGLARIQGRTAEAERLEREARRLRAAASASPPSDHRPNWTLGHEEQPSTVEVAHQLACKLERGANLAASAAR